MANASLKKDFKDGDILFSQQLNNNFGAIEAALATMNKIVWQDDPDDSVVTFRGTTEEVNAREIIDGQLLYDTTTGETYIDYGSQRISTGSGNAIYIGTGAPTNPSTQLWINPEESILPINTEVVNSMEGSETTKAPSVAAVKPYIDTAVSFKGNLLWTNYDPSQAITEATNITLSSSDYDVLEIFFNQRSFNNPANYSIKFLKDSPGTRCYIPSTDGNIYRTITKNSNTSLTISTIIGSQNNDPTLVIPTHVVGYNTGIFDGGDN